MSMERLSKHFFDGTSVWNGFGGEITQYHCGCGQSFADPSELNAHLAEAIGKLMLLVPHSTLDDEGYLDSRVVTCD